MKPRRSISFSELEKVVVSEEQMMFLEAAERAIYIDGKKTDVLEAVTITAATGAVGEVTLFFPPDSELLEKLIVQFPFAKTFSVADLSDLGYRFDDFKIGLYNGNLTVKMYLKEGIK